jgi:flavodoxin
MSKTLVAYYSRSGHTQRIAEMLAKRLGADVEAIQDGSQRSGPGGFLRSAVEALFGMEPELQPIQHPPKDYDLVLVGTPVWFGHVSSPVRRYLRDHRDEIRRAAFFCTQGGRSAQHAFTDMGQVLARQPEGTLSLGDWDIEHDGCGPALDGFAQKLDLH